MNRRGFLAGAAAACAPLPAFPRAGIHYRGYFAWIADLTTFADKHAEWPSMKIDQPLLNDYHETFGLMVSAKHPTKARCAVAKANPGIEGRSLSIMFSRGFPSME